MIVFLHIPKTGGTSFRYILENNFGMRHCHAGHAGKAHFSGSDLRFAQTVFPRLLSIAGHNLANPARLSFKNPFFVTILREPVARVFSHYSQLRRRLKANLDFEKALREWSALENVQVKLMAGESNLDKAKFFLEKQCGFFGFTEKFDLSMHVFNRLSPAKLDVSYQRERVSNDKPARDELRANSRLLELARQVNRLDVELYDFALNEIFPKLCEKAGFRATDDVPRLEIRRGGFRWRYFFGRFYNRVIYREFVRRCRRKSPALNYSTSAR